MTQVLSFLAAAFTQPNGPEPNQRQNLVSGFCSVEVLRISEFRRLVARALKPDKWGKT